MSISILFLVQVPHFKKRLLKEGQRITLDMKAVAVLILEILTRKLNPNLAFFSNFEEIESFCIPDTRFDRMLLNQRHRIPHDLESVSVVVGEISTAKLKSNLLSILTLSISKAFLVQTPDSEALILGLDLRPCP